MGRRCSKLFTIYLKIYLKRLCFAKESAKESGFVPDFLSNLMLHRDCKKINCDVTIT